MQISFPSTQQISPNVGLMIGFKIRDFFFIYFPSFLFSYKNKYRQEDKVPE